MSAIVKHPILKIFLNILVLSMVLLVGVPGCGGGAPQSPTISVEPTPTNVPEPPPPSLTGTDGLPWWNDHIFYEVFVRSFRDSNSDGIGDLQGLIDRLDYLNDGDPSTTTDLGVTGIWLMPVSQSPSYHGYDVTDYRTIEEDYGTNADFKRLVEEAHQRGIAVIVDLVLNHTSNEHPWFQQASTPGSEKEGWYIWAAKKPKYSGPWGDPVWHELDDTNRYYYGLFWEDMPDLNYRNGAVTNEMFATARFWLSDMGVDGFRLDAVRHLIENGKDQLNTPETHTWLQNFDNYVHGLKPDALTVGEIADNTANILPYVPDEVDIAFEFRLAEAILASVNAGNSTTLATQLQKVLDGYPAGQFATFLTNHDMTRTISRLGDSSEKAKLAAALMLSMPGVPFIYYGEEIGLTGVKPDDPNVRRPMQWDASPTAGFTEGTPWIELGTPAAGADVATQDADLGSLLNFYRTLIHLRQTTPSLRAGDSWQVKASHPAVFSLLRFNGGEAVLLVANLTDQPLSKYQLELAQGPLQGQLQATLLDGDILSPGASQPGVPTVNASGGFNAYTPLQEIPPYGVALISLK